MRLKLIVVGILLGSTQAAANPISLREEAGPLAFAGLASLATAIEVTVTAFIVTLLCQIERPLAFIGALVMLNVTTFGVFVGYLYPKIGSVVVLELLIWVAEAWGIIFIIRLLGEGFLSFRQAAAIAFIGNLISFLIGAAL